MSNSITITGQTGRDAEIRFTQSGKAVLGGSVADTPRRFNRDTNAWEDAGDTLWLDWSIWGDEAEALVDQITKGTKVTITGKLKARSYEAKDGTNRTVIEIAADSVAVHPKRGQGQQYGQQRQQQAPAQDPWGVTQSAEAPF